MKTSKLPLYIGYDRREEISWGVAAESARRVAGNQAEIFRLGLDDVAPIMNRRTIPRGGILWDAISEAPMSTEFAFARFCVPIMQWEGWALFTDSDVLFRSDYYDLLDLADDKFAAMVVKHDMKPGGSRTKKSGQVQTYYPRKNWSSVVLWNCAHPSNRRLTKELVNTWPGILLHGFAWLRDEEIGELPKEWNHLVGVDKPNPKAKIVHYTLGGPWLTEYRNCEHSEEWIEVAKSRQMAMCLVD